MPQIFQDLDAAIDFQHLEERADVRPFLRRLVGCSIQGFTSRRQQLVAVLPRCLFFELASQHRDLHRIRRYGETLEQLPNPVALATGLIEDALKRGAGSATCESSGGGFVEFPILGLRENPAEGRHQPDAVLLGLQQEAIHSIRLFGCQFAFVHFRPQDLLDELPGVDREDPSRLGIGELDLPFAFPLGR